MYTYLIRNKIYSNLKHIQLVISEHNMAKFRCKDNYVQNFSPMFQEWSWKRKGEITNGRMCLSSDAIETHGYVMVHFCTNDNSQVP